MAEEQDNQKKSKGKPQEGDAGKGKGKGKGKGGKPPEAQAAAAEEAPAPRTPVRPRLRERFRGEVCAKVKEQFGITNPMALPRLDKIVLSVGLGKQLEGTKLNPVAKEQVLSDLAVISGQKPIVLRAKKSVSNFKVRAGYETGAMVTLRGHMMWEFFDRLVSIGVPRIKDFRGLSPKSFDGRGNYSFGVQEQGIFPEVNMAEAKFTHGMHITFVFRNSTDERSRYVLAQLGMPFSEPGK